MTKITTPYGEYIVENNHGATVLLSDSYKLIFNKRTGAMSRFGITLDDDPDMSPFGPELLDIELSINGCPNNCRWCYKGNSNTPATNMNLVSFTNILRQLPPTVGQIAFGITGTQTNPDFINICAASRLHHVVPNYTLSGIDLTEQIVDDTVDLCGAIAVSAYPDDLNTCLDTVKHFVSGGMKQVNIHLLYHADNIQFVKDVLLKSTQLTGLGAVVLLGLKPKGRGNQFKPASYEQFKHIVDFAFDRNIRIGFDSCSANKFLRYVTESSFSEQEKLAFRQQAEPCESGLFSLYINVHGQAFPCSFAEGTPGWETGIEIPTCNLSDNKDDAQLEFLQNVWYHPKLIAWRNRLLANNRRCPIYNLD